MNAHGTSPGPSRVAIDGKFYNVVPLVTLESRCFYGAAEVTYPPETPGWATAVVEGYPCAAWFEESAIVQLFAQGAAGKHNSGYDIPASATEWCDEHGRPLPEGSDTSRATVACVLCKVVEP